tara:strand:+ start:36 stop:1349 length:1314 start_codon:yes stop_codon:yes gene_type:complete
MNDQQNFFTNKKFLIYGFGKSGSACFNFLKRKNSLKIYDDNQKNINSRYKKNKLTLNSLKNYKFDFIFISPGIDINKCKLKGYLNRNKKKILSDLDIFYLNFPKIKKITITGTNGKSTTSKLLFNVIKAHKKDARLTGNIGNPILLEKNIKESTIFIIEASSYQLAYSKFFKSEYSIILNLSPDHLERHGNFNNYVKSKYKLIKKQEKGNKAFIEKQNIYLNQLIKKDKINSKIIRVNYKKYFKYFKFIKNQHFYNKNNLKNLSFIIALSKYFNLNIKKLIKVTNKFKGLNYRQQIVYNSKKLMVINDSKSTSLSSTKNLLQSFENIYWILGGLAKKGDKFELEDKYFRKIKAFIYGKDKKFFSKLLNKKIIYKFSQTLRKSIDLIFKDIQEQKSKKKVVIFSPSAASFDQFKNFEERGKYFNKIIKIYLKKYKYIL